MSDVVIFHNPACGTSRNVLGLIRHVGIEPTVIEYLKTPPSKAKLKEPPFTKEDGEVVEDSGVRRA